MQTAQNSKPLVAHGNLKVRLRRYTFHGKWQKKRLLCERLEGDTFQAKWLSKLGYQKEGYHSIHSTICFSRGNHPGSGVWYFFDLIGARALSLETFLPRVDLMWATSCHFDLCRFPVLEMFYWRRIVFDEAFGCVPGAC